jgi:type II secretory pathway component PulF
LAAAIGQASGQLAPCLRQSPRWQLATLWLEVIPRIAYPFLLFISANIIVAFQMIFIVPKMEKVFADFKIKLPWVTEHMIAGVRWLLRYEWVIALGFLALIVLIIVMVLSSRVCWHMPIFGRLYRMHAQARLLKALAILLETGKPMPQALKLLLESGYFPTAVRKRLEAVATGVDQGQPLADMLYQNSLLPRAMVPLVQAAGRANNLPWALSELGECHAKRMFRLARQLTMAIFPISVMAIGLAIAVIALGMFLPLVQLISELPV